MKCSLVLLEKVFLPKSLGDLGIIDPLIMVKYLVAKTWWHWVKVQDKLWSHLWKIKYDNKVQEKKLIRMEEDCQGSLIWNNV
jgi:hypothetical protein